MEGNQVNDQQCLHGEPIGGDCYYCADEKARKQVQDLMDSWGVHPRARKLTIVFDFTNMDSVPVATVEYNILDKETDTLSQGLSSFKLVPKDVN